MNAAVVAAAVAAAREAVAARGRPRLLLSGSLDPALAHAVVAAFPPLPGLVETLAPDPLLIEDLLGRLDEDFAAVLVQTPDPFGACRRLDALAAVCRVLGVALIVVVAEKLLIERDGPPPADRVVVAEDSALPDGATAAQVAEATEALVAALRRIPGLRVVTRDPFGTVAVHLGDDRSADAVAPALAGLAAAPLRRLWPEWSELDPVLALRLTALGPLPDLAPLRR